MEVDREMDAPNNAVATILKYKSGFQPKAAFILGSGLGVIADQLKDKVEIPYEDLAGFPVSTVEGHSGTLVIGSLNGVEVACMKGRGHFYEHQTMRVMTVPVRTFKLLGCEFMLTTCAAGSLNPDRIQVGSVVALTDHINTMPDSPMCGKNDEEYGPRFFSLANAYDRQLREEVLQVASQKGIAVETGVYVSYTGPNFETAAEIRMMQIMGGDVVGMSIVPEIITAAHCGLPAFALAAITNMAEGLGETELSHNQTLECAKLAQPKLIKLIQSFMENHFQITSM
ncbi:xanthosine phosphorylase [Sansalvadorimonas sp. 2012CJ34-2]|uniref:Purine nucleoside phosphorylase n=1 Tax=Parendozoicomonas callyspongiae TaxID=2942213 RepID=A0ABT0PHH0_9GAMM|nr:xanthosine phosphorylase [Sansalvadorimonas sp. 2012CJ34-2]MCL6270827.1 xanthosine phosphorylase [Sansalvadorimonas sp. 2012CJ34-2]